MKELTPEETDRLRVLFWKLQEAQGELNRALNEIAQAHGINIEKEQWNTTPDFRRLVKVK